MRVDFDIPDGAAMYQCTQGDWEITARAMNPPKFDAPEGWEHTNECRVPAGDDFWASMNERETFVHSFSVNSEPCKSLYGGRRWILRKKWTPPAEFPEGWWVYHENGWWWLDPRDPCIGRQCLDTAVSIRKWLPNFTPPSVDKIQVKH